MGIKEIRQDIITAMKANDTERANILRSIVNSAQMEAKEKKTEISDSYLISAAQKEIKQAEQALKICEDAGNTGNDFYQKTKVRIEIARKYLPAQLSKDELKESIKAITLGKEYKTPGEVMKVVMPLLKDKANGKDINEAVREMFG